MQKARKILKVGLIGLGNQGKHHLKALLELQEQQLIQLVAICDIKPFIEMRNIPFYENYIDLFTQPKIDVVVLAVPNNMHKKITLTALKYGIHVIKEKPMAIKYKDGLDMIKLANNRKLFVCTMQQRKFDPLFQKTKQYIAKLRSPLTISYTFTLNNIENSWYWNIRKGGGSWLNMGWHAISIIQWLIDTITYIEVTWEIGGKRSWEYQTDHTADANFCIKDLAKGKIHVSCIENKNEELIINAYNGSLKLNKSGLQIRINNMNTLYKPTKINHQKYVDQLKNIFSQIKSKGYNMNDDLLILKTIEEASKISKSSHK